MYYSLECSMSTKFKFSVCVTTSLFYTVYNNQYMLHTHIHVKIHAQYILHLFYTLYCLNSAIILTFLPLTFTKRSIFFTEPAIIFTKILNYW
jgi:hypothetical protein